jgi:hypothetical protein
MNAPKIPSKKKPMTEKQAAQIMTKRRACIQKFRETMKKLPKPSKKKVMEEAVPPVPSVPSVPSEVDVLPVPPKKKRATKKKAIEEEVPSVPLEPVVPSVPSEPEVPPKKKRATKKKEMEEAVPSEQEKVVKKRVYRKKAKEPLEEPLE